MKVEEPSWTHCGVNGWLFTMTCTESFSMYWLGLVMFWLVYGLIEELAGITYDELTNLTVNCGIEGVGIGTGEGVGVWANAGVNAIEIDKAKIRTRIDDKLFLILPILSSKKAKAIKGYSYKFLN